MPAAPLHAGAGDPRFFRCAGPLDAAALAAASGARFEPAASGTAAAFVGVAPLAAAKRDEVSFLDNRKYADDLARTASGLVIVAPALADRRPPTAAALITEEPYLAWARVASALFPRDPVTPGVHPRAEVEGASIDPTAGIGAFAVIGPGASVGPRTRIGAGTVIEAGCVIGADCRIASGVTISHALIGDRVTVHPGARIGQDGFGFALSPEGFVSVPQLGRVVLEDDVDIGANATIDRGSTQDTVIGAGSRLDNLVQIGHNVRLGRCCVVVAQAGISGSTILDDFVTVAAQAGLTGHLRIGARARIGAQAGVMSDVAAATDVLGSPAMGVREFFRNVAVLRRLAKRG